MNVAAIHRTLDQELLAVLRGASLECPVCGEFLLQRPDRTIGCPECGVGLGAALPAVGVDSGGLQFGMQAG